MTSITLPATALFGGMGLALGFAHFQGLRRDARMYLVRGVRGGILAAHAARLLATGTVLVLIARGGAVPLLATLGGFLAARFAAVAQARRSA